MASVTTGFGLASLRRAVEPVRPRDWEASIRDAYQPVQLSPGFWIVPSWAPAPDPGATNIVLEPGLAFGTGDHPTTRLCLRWLRALPALRGAAVMDYGTGSGVLAVAALVLGAARAVGTDVEALAVKAAAQNAALNGVAGALRVLRCGADLAAGEPLEEAGVEGEAALFDV
jgi:ribosomal protein L11 methyltransferase